MSKQAVIDDLWLTFVTEQWKLQVELAEKRLNNATEEENKEILGGIPYSQFTEEAFWCWWAKRQFKEKGQS